MDNSKGQEGKFRLKGLTAAVFTPFHDNGDLNLELISPYIDCLVKEGVKNAFICGTNGEGWSLTVQERKLVAEAWKKVNNGRLCSLVVNVGANGLREGQELAAHAQSIGIDAIASTGPSGYKAKGLDGLVKYLQQVASHAPATPFYYYHFSVTNEPTYGDMEDLIETLKSIPIPTFCGMKFTSFRLFEFKRCLRRPEAYQISVGHDEHLLAALAIGAESFVGGTANFQAKLQTKVIDAYKKKDMEAASSYYDQFLDNCCVLRKYGGGPAVCKVIMKLAHIDLGPCRLPLPSFTPEEEEQVRADLEKIGFFESIK